MLRPGARAVSPRPALGLAIPRPERFRFHYAQQPLSYAVTPFLLEHLLDRGFTRVLFFKQESLVLGDHTPVVELLDRHPILLTAHLLWPLDGPDRVARELNILQSGVFNVGLVGVSAHETARRFLRWWQERVYTHCRHAVPEGMHYEQRWLDLVPGFFEGTHVLRDPGFNVAHWNLPDRSIAIRGDAVLADGVPCRLFRFSGYDFDLPHQPTRYSTRLTWENLGPSRALFERYHRALEENGYQETRLWPYAYSRFDNQVVIPEFVRQLYRQSGEAVARFGDPRLTGMEPLTSTAAEGAAVSTAPAATGGQPDSYYRWLNEPIEGSDGAITRLWHAVYAARANLHVAFPDILGTDRTRFLDWTVASGVQELGIPVEFLSPCRV